MNERIQELIARAEMYADEQNKLYGVSYSQKLNEKFAELIIRECARKANAVALDLLLRSANIRNHPELDGRKYVGDSILKAFGVE
jgi:hypothetical protein